ncbi:MAG: hypothetical protein WDM81_03555 [Rhizomicrobium sp.]
MEIWAGWAAANVQGIRAAALPRWRRNGQSTVPSDNDSVDLINAAYFFFFVFLAFFLTTFFFFASA